MSEALRQADELGLIVADDGQVAVIKDGSMGALGDAGLPSIQDLVSEALTTATKADQDTADELRKLAAAVDVTNPDEAENQVQGAASRDELAILADTIPSNADSAQVSAWWNSLTAQQRTELENAVPLQIYSLDGIPQDVKDQLRGSGGIDRMTLVQFATDHWNDGTIGKLTAQLGDLADRLRMSASDYKKTDTEAARRIQEVFNLLMSS